MKMRLLHRLIRRLIVWASEPSDEECANARREHLERIERKNRLADRVARALAYPPLPSEYVGLSLNELFLCKREIENLSGTSLYSQKNVEAHEQMLRGAMAQADARATEAT